MPSYFQTYGGSVLSAAIDKYVYVSVNRRFSRTILLKYSEMEEVQDVHAIRHRIIRNALLRFRDADGLEITTTADLPSGTGLGSSGAFSVGLVHALNSLHGSDQASSGPQELAEAAFRLESQYAEGQTGIQDPYISAFGDIHNFEISRDGQVLSTKVSLSDRFREEFQMRSFLLFTGFSRDADDLLAAQSSRSLAGETKVIENLHETRALAGVALEAIKNGDVNALGQVFNEQWELKRRRSPGSTPEYIANLAKECRDNGARYIKLVGAGGGGFLLMIADDPLRLHRWLSGSNAQFFPLRLARHGSTVISDSR